MPFLAKNETFSADIPLDFHEAEPGVIYFIVANYTNGSRIENFGRLPFMLDLTGIDGIDADYDATETYYNLMGMEIKNPQPGQIVIVRKGAKSYKRIWK